MYNLLHIVLMAPVSIAASTSPSNSDRVLAMLDLDRDGIVRPMEAADAIQRMSMDQQEPGLVLDDMAAMLRDIDADESEEVEGWLEDLDRNGDGQVELTEVDDEFGPFAATIDTNGNGKLEAGELLAIDSGPVDPFIQMEVEWVFDDFQAEDALDIKDVAEEDEDMAEILADGDINRDGRITREELTAIFLAMDPPASFDVQGTTAVVTGTLDISTPSRMMELILKHPEVDTLILLDCPGSIDDESALHACRMIRLHGFTTIVPANGEVASGGVDLFLSGKHRLVEPGARFGVHSWGGIGESGVDVPRDDESHELYEDYYRDMGIHPDFYWFTLEAADPDDIHWMTRKELEQYQCVTKWVEPGQP